MNSMPLKLSRKRGKSHIPSHKQKKSTPIRLAIFVLVILILILFFGKIFQFSKTLFSPWMDQENIIARTYTWDGTFNINVVLQGENTFLLSYNPQNKTVILIPIPKNTYVDTAYGMGQWQMGSVYNLGETSETNGVNLTEKTVSALFGIPIDGFIQLKGGISDKKADQVVDALKKSPLNIFSIISDLKSDLTLWELIKLKFALADVRFDKVKILDLQKLDVLLSEELPDKTEVFSVDNIRIDGVLSSLIDPNIRDESVSISVFNGTDESLLAQKGARILTNTGAHVITTSNTNKKFKKTFVYGKKSKTLVRIAQIFSSPCQNKEECDKIEPELKSETGFSRADINVVLGADFAQIY